MVKRRATKRSVSKHLYEQVDALVEQHGSPSVVLRALAELVRNTGLDVDDEMKERARSEHRRRTREERATGERFRKYAQDLSEYARKARKRESDLLKPIAKGGFFFFSGD